ncbi:polysaccharide lyase family 1 protein [Massilia sp. G4R7]|uniref:Polysaccharide lyase family 1 protein n=1 Tax=Massilia phyllostachyos TaxID=2898585 RepID=A0ABS8PZM9_9BURK|nr:polysaccharide lyase family 1 protein [Massilia phyllostachyos]MCD2514964.1 polysaccharide lyase family 1 protein [Massilia phyllostachyos]
MKANLHQLCLASSIALALAGCGAGDSASTPEARVSTSSMSRTAGSVAAGTGACPAIALDGIDAQTLTGPSTPLQLGSYGARRPGPPVLVGGKHSPSNYRAAPVLPNWQFATSDPTNGALTFECDAAPANGWHGFRRDGSGHARVVVTGGRNAAPQHVYTVYNGQQLVAALNEAGLAPKIIRVIGHIDLRMSANNTVFKEYESYTDQKFGGSINIPSNTTLVGINDAQGRAARITGTTLLIGSELALAQGGDPEADFKAWIAAGKDGDLFPTWTRNVIIRNLAIDTPWDVNPEDSANAYADGVTISRSQNVWVDHITMSDGDTPDRLASDTRHDGALDIVRGSDYVTLSNSIFTKHGKTTLVGNGDSGRAWSDEKRLHVTFHGLHWHGTASRLPLIRFGQLHTFNNLLEGDTSPADPDMKFQGGLDVRYRSDVLSENNYYLFKNLKPSQVGGKVSGGKDAVSYRASGELFINDKGDDTKPWVGGAIDISAALLADPGLPRLSLWTPPYAYTALPADQACVYVKNNAGAGRVNNPGTGATCSAAGTGTPPTTPPTTPTDPGTPTTPPVGTAPVCTGLFACNGGVGQGAMNPAVTAAVSSKLLNGVWTITGAGNISTSTSYNHYFKYMPLTGNFVMTARLLTQGGSSSGARAGLLATDSLSGSGTYAWTARYANTGEIRRAINGDNKSVLPGYSTSTLPVWVRIERRGNALYSAASRDGLTWTEATSVNVTATTLYVGMAVSSGSNTAAQSATFSKLSVIGGGLN